MTPDAHDAELTPEQIRRALAGEWCPPRVPDDELGTRGYLWVPNWRKFQHYRNRRPPWIKTYVELLDDDAWLALTATERTLLLGAWMLVARAGQGRYSARTGPLQSSIALARRHVQSSLVSLNHAGFLYVIASKLPATGPPRARAETETETEEGSQTPLSVERSTPRPRSRTRTAHAARAELADDRNGHEPELVTRLRENRASVLLGIAGGYYDRDALSFLSDDQWHELHAEATLAPEDRPL
jgi:hypothetical protein